MASAGEGRDQESRSFVEPLQGSGSGAGLPRAALRLPWAGGSSPVGAKSGTPPPIQGKRGAALGRVAPESKP